MSSDTLTVEALNEFKNRKESGTVLDKKLDLWKNLDRRVKDYHDDARSFLFGSCMTGNSHLFCKCFFNANDFLALRNTLALLKFSAHIRRHSSRTVFSAFIDLLCDCLHV